MDFVKRIEAHARRQGFSVNGLFQAAGLPSSLMTAYRSGLHGIRLETLNKLLAVGKNTNPRTIRIPARRRREDRLVKSA